MVGARRRAICPRRGTVVSVHWLSGPPGCGGALARRHGGRGFAARARARLGGAVSAARVGVAVAATLLFLPAARYGFVQDDPAIIAANPAAHSLAAGAPALRPPDRPPAPRRGAVR